jgi:hypothetical protein
MTYNFENLRKLKGVLVLVENNKGHKHLGVILDVVANGFTTTGRGSVREFYYHEVSRIVHKNISLTSPSTLFSEKILDAFATKIIENIKSSKDYRLMTRSAIFERKDGKVRKNKIGKSAFGITVYSWIKKHDSPIAICPMALMDEQFLLCIYDGLFCLIRKNYSIVFHTENTLITDLIFSSNGELIQWRQNQLDTTFKGIINLL